MQNIIIEGGKLLNGTINISGAKNSVVALIPIGLLASQKAIIKNVPNISDTKSLLNILKRLNCNYTYQNEELIMETSEIKNNFIPAIESQKLRASYYFMGVLLAKFNYVKMSVPGGCKIGKRPIDLHLKGFKALNADIIEKKDYIIIKSDKLIGNNINLDFPSVGATINLMIAATSAEGTTTINNAACEPEIENIAEFLNNLGADIKGAGTKKITIVGPTRYHNGAITTIPDRIEAGTYIILGALIGNNLKIKGIVKDHISSLLLKLKEMRVPFKIHNDEIIISKSSNLSPIDIISQPYPGFPTDLGQPITVLLSQCSGISHYKETIWENRNGHVPYLNKMNADITIKNNTLMITGPKNLIGQEVVSTDLRGGAALILAGLIAQGKTRIKEIEHILRGYEDIVEKLQKVGAKINIVEIE